MSNTLEDLNIGTYNDIATVRYHCSFSSVVNFVVAIFVYSLYELPKNRTRTNWKRTS